MTDIMMTAAAQEEMSPDECAAYDAIPAAEAIVAETLGVSARRATPLIGLGSVNLILFVDSDAGEMAVRIGKPWDDPHTRLAEYEKERWCIARAAAAGVPGPTVRALGIRNGRAFMVQDRLPGLNGKQSALTPFELLRIMGDYARRIHAIPTTGFGDTVSRFESGAGRDGWLRFVDYNLGELTSDDPLLALKVYSLEQQDLIREAFTWLRRLPLQVGLNHGDLSRRNTIVGPDGRVSVLDWGCAEMHIVPHYDLCAFLDWYAPDEEKMHAFLRGYGIDAAEWERLQPELRAFSLLKSFDLTRWAIDRCPARIDEIAERARRAAGQYLASHAHF